jgi:hypothetical protein
VVTPRGLTVPVSVAEKLATLVAAAVATIGPGVAVGGGVGVGDGLGVAVGVADGLGVAVGVGVSFTTVTVPRMLQHAP